jgi:hypothetical protein
MSIMQQMALRLKRVHNYILMKIYSKYSNVKYKCKNLALCKENQNSLPGTQHQRNNVKNLQGDFGWSGKWV